MATSTGVDARLLLVAMSLLAVVLLGVALERALQPVRPPLPAADLPPAGLGRLVPVGPQIDAEAWRGLGALDLWLRSARSRP